LLSGLVVKSFRNRHTKAAAFGLPHQFRFSCLDFLAEGIHVDISGLCLREDAVTRLLLLGNMVLYILRQHLDLGIVKFFIR